MPLCCSFKRVQLFTLIIAAAIIISILMILFFFSYPTFARQRIIDAVVFKNGTDAIERFRTTKELKNLRLSFYLYNVTNAQEITTSSSAVKFNLQEIGPFVYSELKYKEFLNNNQTSGRIKFKLRRRFILDETLSVADPKKILITWPNVPLLSTEGIISKLSFLIREGAKEMIEYYIRKLKEPAFITDTAERFIFEGSKRNLFEKLQNETQYLYPIEPWPLKDNKFGLLYGKNNSWDPTTDFEYTVSAGFGLDQTYENLNKYIHVNDSKTLKFWRSQPPECNSVGGTDGEFFPPFLGQPENLEVYSIDMCRKLSLKFREQTSIKGIGALKYTLDEKSIQSGHNNPENQCYCLARDNDVPKPECNLDGLMDLSTCVTPNIVASGAHFMAGSKELIDRVTGLSPPNASLHEPTLHIEPNTGLTLKATVPIQFNVRLEKGGFNMFNFFKDNETLILPLLWVTESSELTDSQAQLLRSRLLLLDSWLVSMVLGGAIIFILAILVVATIVCIKFRDSRAIDPTEIERLIHPTVPSNLPN